MESSRSCIMGGLVSCAMMGSKSSSSQFYTNTAPMQMDIIVPTSNAYVSASARIHRFLSAMDYELQPRRPSSGTYEYCTSRVDLYHHPVMHLLL
jgi:hypothetical protein